ncbi:hypothetical protein Lsed01_02027 [Demequina sediminis]|uniref:Uncharacterized protein n=1 Tax=Demequina sediminis TaxID=1930058 RepID=A0ABP9WIC2_9MICO
MPFPAWFRYGENTADGPFATRVAARCVETGHRRRPRTARVGNDAVFRLV